MRRWRPKGTAGLERSRVSGCRRSPLPPAMIIARARRRRAMPSARRRGAVRPRRIDVGEAEVLALEPAQGVGVVHGERLTLDPARHLAEPLELRVVLGHAAL